VSSCGGEVATSTKTAGQSRQTTATTTEKPTTTKAVIVTTAIPTVAATTTNAPTTTTTKASEQTKYQEVVVSRHVDGDTVYVEFADGSEEKVRFIGVNCPESTTEKEEFGEESSAFTKEQLLNGTVYLEKDVSETDRYGRLLRYIWLEVPNDESESEIQTKMFNAILVLSGFAQAATYPPDVKFADNFVEYQRTAREKEVGLWEIAEVVVETTKAIETTKIAETTKEPVGTHYVGSVKSDKYHLPSCRYVKDIKEKGNAIYFDTKEDAEKQGYVPCKVCKP
jgi:micrococcal nuclease